MRKQRYKEKRPLGAMSNSTRKREDENQPAFAALMVKHGLLPPRSSADSRFAMFMRVCEDHTIRERSNKRMARKKPAYLASFAAGYVNTAAVLNAMSPKEIQQLRERLNISPVREFAVL